MPVDLTKVKEIYPEPTYTNWYIGGNLWACEACRKCQVYVPKTYEGPGGPCPFCGVVPTFVQTTLRAALPFKPLPHVLTVSDQESDTQDS